VPVELSGAAAYDVPPELTAERPLSNPEIVLGLVAGEDGERGGGGDWVLIGQDGWGRLDVRTQIETHDGAFIYLTYGGVVEMTEQAQKALAEGGETRWEDQYFRTTPRLETGDSRYAWVNQSVFLAQGRIYPGGVQYRIYRVT
jgi:hypothetical protein